MMEPADQIEKLFFRLKKLLVPLGNWLAEKKLNPDVLTWLGLLLALGAGWAAAYGHFLSAALLALTSGLMDALDGVVARERISRNKGGAVLDSSIDRYSDFFLLAGIGLFYSENFALLLLSFLSIIGSFMVSYATAKSEALSVTGPQGRMKRQERWAVIILGLLIAAAAPQFATLAMLLSLGLVAIGANTAAIIKTYKLRKEASRWP